MHVLIIGGGVMGCAAALELAQRGVKRVTVLERAVPGAEASSSAAGMLAAQVEAHDTAERARYVAARESYPAWASMLREHTGLEIGFRRSGILSLVRTATALVAAENELPSHHALGLRAEVLTGTEARSIEPAVADNLAGAIYYPDEAQVEPPLLLRALAVAVARAGVNLRSGATVKHLVIERDSCVGVEVTPDEVLYADAVVLAAGSWSSFVPGVPEAVPQVRPVRGQLVQLEERPPRMRTILFENTAYIVPRGDGRVVCGSTMENVGHQSRVTAEGLAGILASTLAMAPGLSDAEVIRAWCNFRPHVTAPQDAAPLVGASPLNGLFLATGHHRNGILLAKVTAEAVTNAILSPMKPAQAAS